MVAPWLPRTWPRGGGAPRFCRDIGERGGWLPIDRDSLSCLDKAVRCDTSKLTHTVNFEIIIPNHIHGGLGLGLELGLERLRRAAAPRAL